MYCNKKKIHSVRPHFMFMKIQLQLIHSQPSFTLQKCFQNKTRKLVFYITMQYFGDRGEKAGLGNKVG